MSVPDYSAVVSATGFLRPRASRSIASFQEHIVTSHRILALLGAGLSAPSGLPTFRGAGGLWRTYGVKQLATPAAFKEDPALVWTFFLDRIKAAREATPNKAHDALAELARRKDGFLTISMNIDGLSGRVNHPPSRIYYLHGNLFDVKCSRCNIFLRDTDAKAVTEPLHRLSGGISIQALNVPHCPSCEVGLLRPAVFWFTEALDSNTLRSIHSWIEEKPSIDTMLVIGTSAEVYPATAYIEAARKKGARVAVVNIEQEDPGLFALEEQDWYLQGDAAQVIPEMLKPVIGELPS
ncbi:DHS-like NAD/FAD-binding domain-containing protein [Lojkania enalia]|uniref:DHS-like NAD/FAD-binding domain-containing protein n=1 Tax=Lojkania enalia TaxID=147567 RepID=A0A9P4K1J4_9PLEO|nr:DHS-like NAD/FAD-binding domain-containing protein [Didymosphaeria enalia]